MGKITGYKADSPEKFLLDAGAFLKNYDLSKTYDENVTAGALIGATVGGGSFSAVPEVRKQEVDGAKGNVKGLQAIDGWTVTMVANAKEVTADNLKIALGAADSVTVSDESAVNGYTKITARDDITDADYADNIAWVGKLAGKNKPVIILIKNAISLNGLSLTFADKNEATIPVTITGNYDAVDLETPPYEIYYPAT